MSWFDGCHSIFGLYVNSLNFILIIYWLVVLSLKKTLIEALKHEERESLYESNRMSVCNCVPKDLTNHWTVMVLLYNVACHRFWKFYNYFGGGYQLPPRKIAPKMTLRQNWSPKKYFLLPTFLFKTKIKSGGGSNYPIPHPRGL